MTSTFFGFNIAKTGLAASQMALNTIAHNIANANTEGFSRQRLTTKSENPDIFPTVPGIIGKGVRMNNISQIRDEFLDAKYRKEMTKGGEYSALSTVYRTLEAIINEPSKSGIKTVINEFFSALHELNKSPESLTTRALLRQTAIALTQKVKGMSEAFKSEQANLDFEITVVASEINGYARQISDLNKVIYTSELDGTTANDLRDQRNLIVDKLSELVDINYYEDNKGRFYIDVNGRALVSHYTYDQLKVVERAERLNPYDLDRLHDLEWESGSSFTIGGGKLGALDAMKSNVSGTQKGIPYYVDKLNEFIDTLATEFNRVHKKGYDIDGNTGINLFTSNNQSSAEYEANILSNGLNGGPAIDVTSVAKLGTSTTYSDEANEKIIRDNINKILDNTPNFKGKSVKYIKGMYVVADRFEASKITIASDIEKDLNKISASATAEGAPGDGDNALNLAKIRHNTGLYSWGSPDDFINSLVSNLGVDAQDSIRNEKNEKIMIKQISFNRQSVMGVSLDEEMANMVKFQHSYNAAGRMMNVLDEMIDLIVNRLGTAGR